MMDYPILSYKRSTGLVHKMLDNERNPAESGTQAWRSSGMRNGIAAIAGALVLTAFSAPPQAPPEHSAPPPVSAAGHNASSAVPPVMRMLWQNTATGDHSIWLMNGTNWDGSYALLPQEPTAWSIAGTGDFNADGSADIVWQNTVTGARLIWFMDGTSWAGSYAVLPQQPIQWSIAGVGDFNADGQPDLVWENTTTGDRSIWFMNGATWDGTSYALLPQEPVEWRIAAVADFNADHKPDLVWQNISTGERSIWFMDGATWPGNYALLQTVVPEWQIKAAADFDGDGDPDLVWQNISTGDRSIWLMTGSTWPGTYAALPNTPTQWSIAGMLPPDQSTPGGNVVVNVADVNAGAVSERDLCLTIAVGPTAASECGDLRIVHELPSVRTLNKERTPVLVYNSAYGEPFPSVAANVTLQAGTAGLDSVVAILKLNGVERGRSVYQGNAWPGAQTSRIALALGTPTEASGIYRHTLEVTAYYATISSKRSVSGDLVIVNRKQSAFGAGWWLAGLDQLVFDPMGNPSVWIGGDGSARRYLAAGASWVAPSIDRPDTLKRDGSGYVRLLSGGVKVRFDSVGRHIATRNRMGFETTFSYDVNGRLDHIAVPFGAGSYQFHYSGSGQLSSVDAPANPGQNRVTTIYQSGARIDSIMDPDLTRVRFAYPSGSSALIAARTNRLGARTMFAFDLAEKVVSSKLRVSSSDSIYTKLRPKESTGFAIAGAGALDTALAYTRLDGPRTDVADTILFWLDRFGSSVRIRNAVGAVTSVTRGNPTFPALATQLVDPAGVVTTAQYDARGNPISVTTFNPLGDNRNAVTSYAWDPLWDEVTRVTMPEGDTTTFQYHPTNGNRLWQQLGGDTLRRVRFFYENSYALPSSILVPDVGRDSIVYDQHGNPATTLTPSHFPTFYIADAIGRDTLRLFPIDSTHQTRERITYDSADRVKTSTTFGPQMQKTPTYWYNPSPADSVIVTNQYDAEGGVLQVSRTRGVLYPGYAPISTYYQYDSADRKISEQSFGTAEKYVYDPAGNVVRLITARNDSITMSYDATNRLAQRVVPRVSYPQTLCSAFIDGFCSFSFPEREGPNLCIAADTSTFGYDAPGRMVKADNGSARVRRMYYRNGALKSDTLKTAKYAPPCAPMPGDDLFTTHVYGLAFTYDLDGRRTTLTHPSQFCASGNCVEHYTYDNNISALDTVVDIRGNRHSFAYDLAGRLSTWHSSGNVVDEFRYDPESNLRAHTNAYLSDSSTFDWRGKMVSAHTQSPQGTADILLSYSGLGAVTASEQQGNIGGFNTEEFVVDALGNRAERQQTATDYDLEDPHRLRTMRYNSFNQLEAIEAPSPQQPYFFLYRENYYYDPAGNTTLFHRITNGNEGGGQITHKDLPELKKTREVSSAIAGVGPNTIGSTMSHEESSRSTRTVGPSRHDSHMSYYDADNKLRVFNRVIGVGPLSDDRVYGMRGTFDEYRYDALGRRVLARTRRLGGGCPGTLDCQSRAVRTVWDGDRILYEIRAVGGDIVQDTTHPPDSTLTRIESITRAHDKLQLSVVTPGPNREEHMALEGGLNSSAVRSFAADTIPDPAIESDGTYVSYTHALGVSGIDEPIGIHKFASQSIFPHTGWRGMLAMGTYPNGAESDCAVAVPCDRIDWPAANVTIDKGGYARSEAETWFGSLASTGTEGSGLQYLRNRYYDPKRGQFTQADPVGVGGGMNLYGFANGDAINYSDPFGLCPKGETCRRFTFGHLSSKSVEENDQVSSGQVIGQSGNTGESTGPHLHYEVGDVDAKGTYKADMSAGPSTDGCPLADCSNVSSRPAGMRKIVLPNGKVHLRPHKGTDIKVPEGTVVHAPQGGEVVKSGWENPKDHHQGYGLRVTIDVVKVRKHE